MLILPRVTEAQPSSLTKVALPPLTGVITLEGSAGSLFVNDLPATPPTSVTEADVVQLGLTASATISDTVYCSVYVDAVKTMIGSATTADTVRRNNYPRFENKGPFDITTYDDGYPYYKTNYGASLHDGLTEIDTSFAITDRVLDTKTIDTTVPEVDYVLLFDTVWWVNHYSDKLLRISMPSKTMLPPVVLPIGSNPYAIGWDSMYNFAVSCTGTNKVLVWDSTFEGSPIYSVDCSAPKGLVVYNGIAYVAESGSHYVLRIDLTNLTFDRVSVGQGPVEVCADTTGVYVTCLDDTLWKVGLTGSGTTHVSTSRDPIGVIENSGYVYVACSFDNVVEVYDRQLNKQATIQTHNEPQYLGIGNNQLAVCCHGDNRVEFYDLTTRTKVGTTLLNNWGFGVSFYNSHWYVFNGNSGTPPRSYIIDSTVTPFGFKPHYAVTLSTLQSSNEIVVEGFDSSLSLPCSIAPIDTAILYKNGSPVSGNATTVVNGDKLRLSVVSDPDYNVLTRVPVTVGNYSVDFLVLTYTYDTTVNPIWFEPVIVATSGAQVFSSEKIVDGMTPGFTTVCSIDTGTLFLNGVAHGQSATVKNGDKIKIQQTSAADFVTTNFTIGGHVNKWLIYVSKPKTELVSFGPIPPKFGCDTDVVILSDEGLVTTTAIWDYYWQPPELRGFRKVELQPVEGYNVYKNGELVEYIDPQTPGYQPVLVQTGDKLRFDVQTSTAIYEGTYSFAVLDGQLISAEARTAADISPYPILIEELYETLPRNEYRTDPIYMEGVSGPDAPIPISVDYGTLLVNDVAVGSSATVYLHDKIEWVVVAEGPYSGVLKYTMQYGDTTAVWRLHNISLGGVYLSHADYLGGVSDLSRFMRETPVVSAQALAPTQYQVMGQSTNVAVSPLPVVCTKPVDRKLLAKQGSWAITQVNNLCVLPNALVADGFEALVYQRGFELALQREALSYEREFVQTRYATACNAQEPEFTTSPENEVRLFDPGFVSYGLGVVNLDVREFEGSVYGEIQLASWSFDKNEYIVGIAFDPQFVQERPTLALELIPREAQVYGFGVVNLPDSPAPYVHAVEETRLTKPVFESQFDSHSEPIERPAYREIAVEQPSVLMQASKEVAVEMPSVQMIALDFHAANYTVETGGCVKHQPLSPTVYRGPATYDNGWNFKQTDFPSYDGKFSTPELAAKVAAINGFKDAEVFLDPDNRYIYRGVCALRTSYNVMGWIRGG